MIANPLAAFLGLLGERPEAAWHRQPLEQRLGAPLMARLLDAGVLVPGEEATWYPCTGSGENCPRLVRREAFPGTAQPHFALCRDQECEHLRLGPEDLQTVSVATSALTR